MSVKLSVVIITFNEERNIGRCIDAIRDIADDIVVLDSFSTDKTKEIALSKGARFIEHAFDGHIQQKNRAIEHALFPHILSLDADEFPDEKLKQEILRVKEDFAADGYYFNRLNNYCGKWLKHGGWYPDRKLRLWDSRKGKWAGENPHDRFELKAGATKKLLPGNLLHYSFTTLSEHVLQVNKFTDISAKAAIAKGRRSNLLKILIMPIWKFKRDYIFRLGFLDGYYGFVASNISAYAKFLKLIKMKALQDSKKIK